MPCGASLHLLQWNQFYEALKTWQASLLLRFSQITLTFDLIQHFSWSYMKLHEANSAAPPRFTVVAATAHHKTRPWRHRDWQQYEPIDASKTNDVDWQSWEPIGFLHWLLDFGSLQTLRFWDWKHI